MTPDRTSTSSAAHERGSPAAPRSSSATGEAAGALPLHAAATGRAILRLGVGLGRWLLGAWLCLVPLFSVLVVGWTARAARREVVRAWWRRSPPRARGVSFEAFVAEDPATCELAGWPTWFAGPRQDEAGPGGRRFQVVRWLGGLGTNARVGAAMILNTWVITLPGCLLWAISWFAGWQNSFNKGYEHAWFGPTIFVLGMLLFPVAMVYLPMAQARQASTGNWRSFYQFRLVWLLVRREWPAGFGVALAWAGACVAVFLVKLAPAIAQYIPGLLDLPRERQLEVSQRFFAVAALGLFPLYVSLRLLAARMYANALRDAWQRGAITEEDLDEREWQALRRLELLVPTPVPERRRLVRLAAWLATRAGRITATMAILALWFATSFLFTVSEFIARTGSGRGWWNQPMIQLPWFDYTPRHLRGPGELPEADPGNG